MQDETKVWSMRKNADKLEDTLTPEKLVCYYREFKLGNDPRITKVGDFIRRHSIDGYDIIGQTCKSLENRGFREVSPMNFLDNHTRFGWYSNDMRIATV